MTKAHTTWKVLPHGPIEKLSERLWRVEGDLEGMPLKRVMSIAKRADGTLIVHNAIALEAAAMAEVDAWGNVAVIAVPNGYHRLDAKVFHDRYPDAEIVCPGGARAKVEQVVKVTRAYRELPADGAVTVEELEGTKGREGVLIIRDADGISLVFNDCVFNMPHGKGIHGFVLRRITGSTGGPKVTRLAKWFLIGDKVAFRAHLERLADLPGLRRVVVSHHITIDQAPARVLRDVASAMA